MYGLDESAFANHLLRKAGKVFMSEVTKKLVTNWPNQKYKKMIDFIDVMSYEAPLVLTNYCDDDGKLISSFLRTTPRVF